MTAALRALVLLVLLSPLGCGTLPPVPSSYTCDTYCDNALARSCPFAQPAPGDGATCAQVCQAATSVVRWDLGCRSTASTCEAIDACER